MTAETLEPFAQLRQAMQEVPTIRRRLQGAFPSASRADVEDAVQHAFLQAVEHSEAFCGAVALHNDRGLRWLVMVGWRFLRGEFRRFAVKKRAVVTDHDTFLDAAPSPATVVERRAELRRVESLLDRAASLHGPACEARLREALLSRICEEDTDANSARRYGVPREYVNRSRRWIADQLRRP